jgi:hypothetical protein
MSEPPQDSLRLQPVAEQDSECKQSLLHLPRLTFHFEKRLETVLRVSERLLQGQNQVKENAC